ncbi:MAG: helix-turn-helix domain-containing protein [Clostridiales Family XIII bacterium]|jgi:transcriptional regulator with XRE-family HTH domain|nr:helix-turn-helix domain-containing protein [Clostridiales Family XIII bacterium]
MKHFGEKLRAMRKQCGFSQEALAEKLGVSRQAITKWETDGGLPDIENIIAIAALFSVPLDDLLSEEKTLRAREGFAYESVTEYDIERPRHFDIKATGAQEVVVTAAPGSEKLRVRLCSNILQNLAQDFKVKIDEHGRRIDVDIRRARETTSEAEAKDALTVQVFLPCALCEEAELSAVAGALGLTGLPFPFEFDGRAGKVRLSGVTGRVALNSSADMDITCDALPPSLEINQISASSTLHIPKEVCYCTKIKGKSNTIRFSEDGRPAESGAQPDAAHRVELAGMNAELLIDAYTIGR